MQYRVIIEFGPADRCPVDRFVMVVAIPVVARIDRRAQAKIARLGLVTRLRFRTENAWTAGFARFPGYGWCSTLTCSWCVSQPFFSFSPGSAAFSSRKVLFWNPLLGLKTAHVHVHMCNTIVGYTYTTSSSHLTWCYDPEDRG